MRLLPSLLLSALLSSAACAAELSHEVPPPPPLDKAGSESQGAPAAKASAPTDQGEPQVTITKKDEQTIEEYRVGGRLYMIKVTPKHGKPYYLVDDQGDGRFVRQEGLDTGLRPPRWIIHSW